ncbi:Transforming growth factor beta-1-induced transcript 1 protein, partial [Rhizophlyctis rosea]
PTPRRATIDVIKRPSPPPDQSSPEPETLKPLCAFCEEPIAGKAVALLGRFWHREHSQCKECHRPIGVDNFAEIDGYLWCEDHYFEHRGEYHVRKNNPTRKRDSYIENELTEIKQLSTVRKIRNLMNFEKSVKLNIVTVDNGDKGKRRFVTSWLPEEWRVKMEEEERREAEEAESGVVGGLGKHGVGGGRKVVVEGGKDEGRPFSVVV